MPQAKLMRYQSAMFDSDNWNRVDLRAGDIIVSTPPKAGTTWTLAMIYLLLHGPDASFDSLSRVAPWIDLREAEMPLKGDGRRLFKTHTPLDGVPIVEGVDYIAVFRDPAASLLSMRRHLSNMVSTPVGHPNAGPWHPAFEQFLTGPFCADRFGGLTLSILQHYLRCARASATLILHYADLVADPPGATRQLAHHLGINCSEENCEKITQITNQDNMARDADRFAPEASNGTFKDKALFFTSAKVAPESLSDHEVGVLQSHMHAIFEPADVTWLMRGT